MTNKTTKNYGFSTVFLQFLGFGSNFSAPNYQIDSVDSFASLETPGGLKGIKVVELFVFEKYFSCFLDGGAAWQKKLFS